LIGSIYIHKPRGTELVLTKNLAVNRESESNLRSLNSSHCRFNDVTIHEQRLDMKPPEPDPAFEISLRPPAFSEFTGQIKVRERLELMVKRLKSAATCWSTFS